MSGAGLLKLGWLGARLREPPASGDHGRRFGGLLRPSACTQPGWREGCRSPGPSLFL